MFRHLESRELQSKICIPYNIHYKIMISWLHSFTYLRNLCAHHSRLWNR
ncbi:MAG: Abi family protein, partial [Candidatus Electrothrix sp. AR4]|nr:Abi family protein [Candidatus Electrothrix sp. AR4]